MTRHFPNAALIGGVFLLSLLTACPTPVPAPSGDATLKGLALVSGGSSLALEPSFGPQVTAYKTYLLPGQTDISVAYSTAHGKASVQVLLDGESVIPGALDVSVPSDQKMEVRVRAEDGSIRTYSVDLIKAKSADLGTLAWGSLTSVPEAAVASLQMNIPEDSEVLLLYVNATSSSILPPGAVPGQSRRAAASAGGLPSLADRIRDSNREIAAGLRPAVPGRSVKRPARVLTDLEVGKSGFSYATFEGDTVPMVLRHLQQEVGVEGDEKRSLHIWVAEDCWGPDSQKAYKVDAAMVEILGDRFLKPGLDNDIYDWTTGLVGAEYGPDAMIFDDLIPFDRNIHIFVYDLENDNSTNGGMMGYFWSGNNVLKSYHAESNEVVAFTVDAVALANPDSGDGDTEWSPEDYWPREIFSTLAHELQHTVSFYQKTVGTFDPESGMEAPIFPETWLEEMNSMVVEDYLAEKMNVQGPRGVDAQDFTAGDPGNYQGRIPLYNMTSDLGLTNWRNGYDVLVSYSHSYAFGAYLARTYGPGLVRALVQSTDRGLGDVAVRLAGEEFGRTGLTVSGLLAEWQSAVQLSSQTEAPAHLRMNRGGRYDFTLGAKSYSLGSMNHFNYGSLKVWNESDWSGLKSFEPASVNVLNLGIRSGKVEKVIQVPGGMAVWVLVR